MITTPIIPLYMLNWLKHRCCTAMNGAEVMVVYGQLVTFGLGIKRLYNLDGLSESSNDMMMIIVRIIIDVPSGKAEKSAANPHFFMGW